MGCFFACFGGACACKHHRKRRHLVNATPPESPRDEVTEALQLVESTKQEASEKPIKESKEKLEGALSCNTKKKVTFDSNVKTYEDLDIGQVRDNNLVKNNENKEIDNLVESNEKKESDDDLVESKSNESKGSENKEDTSEVPNHRYQNCATSEDDYDDDLNLEESEINDDCDDMGGKEKILLVQEDSSESLFSLSIGSRNKVCEVEFGEKEVNSPLLKCGANQQLEARDRSQYIHSVLNPVENLTQWKVVKATVTPPPPPPLKYQDKENINSCPEPSFKLSTGSSKLNKEVVDEEIAVDTSLSSWLVESKATPMSKTSTISDGNLPRSRENKPVLKALKVEEIKQLSAFTSARQPSRCCSPDKPKVGTIGSYWSHTGKIIDSDSGSSSQAMSKTRSKNSKDGRVEGHSTPLQSRFESWIEF